eukprot:164846-Pelagomonas_calceolata.AAC.2
MLHLLGAWAGIPVACVPTLVVVQCLFVPWSLVVALKQGGQQQQACACALERSKPVALSVALWSLAAFI